MRQFIVVNNFSHMNPKTKKTESPPKNRYQIRKLVTGQITQVFKNGRTSPAYRGEEPIDEIEEREGVYVPLENFPTFEDSDEADKVVGMLLKGRKLPQIRKSLKPKVKAKSENQNS